MTTSAQPARLAALTQKIAALRTSLSERIAHGEKFDSAQVIAKLQRLAADTEALARTGNQHEDQLHQLEAAVASLSAAFEERPPRS